MSEARPVVKRARLDPRVIAEWNAVCARDAVLRRRLRDVWNGGAFFGVCMIAISSASSSYPSISFLLIAAGGLALAVGVLALIWNNLLVGRPPCPACSKPVTMTASGHGWSASQPEAQEWCPHCYAWLKHPSDPHRPLA